MADEENTPDPSEEAREAISGELVRHKVEEAYKMRLASKTYQQIADELGYASAWDVAHAIQARMKSEATRLTQDDRESILAMELDRMDALRAAHWEAAMLGDLKSGELILKITDRVIKMVGLDSIDTAAQTHAVLVVGGAEQDYVAKLKELTDGSPGS